VLRRKAWRGQYRITEKTERNTIYVAAISSPGLSAAPAIAPARPRVDQSQGKLIEEKHLVRKQSAFNPTIEDT
jgi:hypothetical protein